MKRLLWTVLTLGLLSTMGYSLAQTVTQPPPILPRPADAAKAKRELPPAEGAADFRQPTELAKTGAVALVGGNGVIEPRDREVKVSATVSGRIAEVRVQEGQRVAAGDVLVALVNDVETAAIAVAEAELAAAKARLVEVQSGSRVEDVRAAAADAKQARARAALSRGVAERTAKLFDGGAATADELDRAKKQAEVDAFAGKAAQSRQSALANGSRVEAVAVAEADVRTADARLAEARVRLAERDVRAPSAGEVLQVKVRAGELAQPGGVDPLVVLGDTTSLTARVDIDERDVAAIALGTAVTIRAKASPGRAYPGTIREIARRMGRKNVRTDDPTERSDTKILEVVVALKESDGLYVGQRVVGMVAAK